mgnify:CR=1 FL=1
MKQMKTYNTVTRSFVLIGLFSSQPYPSLDFDPTPPAMTPDQHVVQ